MIVLVAVGVSVLAVFTLTASVNTYIDRTADFTTSGTLIGGEGLTVSSAALTWGELPAGSTTNQTVTITNNLNGPAALWLSPIVWTPADASEYLALTLDYGGSPILSHGTRDVVLTLTVHANATQAPFTQFSNQVTINGVWG